MRSALLVINSDLSPELWKPERALSRYYRGHLPKKKIKTANFYIFTCCFSRFPL